MAIPIIHFWENYFSNYDEGLGSSYERIIIHNKLMEIVTKHNIKSVLEAPSFGFTGLSGINSMGFAKAGLDVTILDHDQHRLELINQVWEESALKLKSYHTNCYNKIELPDKTYDLSWNFSALWFVDDIKQFLTELDRVTTKIIVLAVPNRSGIGYLSQKYFGKDDLKRYLKEENIIPKNFKPIMQDLGWELLTWSYFDCPPWPDIGMAKEDFLKKFGLSFLVKEKLDAEPKKALTILDYWRDIDKGFKDKMLSYYWLEKYAPACFKAIWAHHKYYVFKRRAK